MADVFPAARGDTFDPETPSALVERAETQSEGLGATLGALAGQTAGEAFRYAKRHLESTPLSTEGTLKGMSSPEAINEKYGFTGEHRVEKWMSDTAAAELAEAVKKRRQMDATFSRFANAHSWPTNMAVGMVGSMLDPLEGATMLIPGVGEERIAYKLAQAGAGARTAIVAGKVGAGATAAMAGTAALEPLRFVADADELREHSMRDAMTDMFYAAPFGAIMHAGVSPAIGYGASRLRGVKPEPYFHNYYWPEAGRAPEDFTAADMRAAVRRGVAQGIIDTAPEGTLPPVFGHVNELANMSALDRHAQQKANIAQLLDGREVDNTAMHPDHSEAARKIAPEAHAEWDRLQAEHDELAAEHVWGAKPTPEQLNDPAYHLEQQLREAVRDVLPVSWDLRVAASLKEGELPGGGMYAIGRTRKHVPSPEKKPNFESVGEAQTPVFKIEDNQGTRHDVNISKNEDGVLFSIDKGVASVRLGQRPDGRWEVKYMRVAQGMRGSGIMGKIYDAIEHEYGFQMIPSGILLEKGYNFWKKRNPELVKYHRTVGEYTDEYNSPRLIKEQIDSLKAEIAKARKNGEDALAEMHRSELKPWVEAWSQIPKEGKTKQALEAMYSFGGVSAENPPKGLALAKRMERAGQRKEDTWRETGWHRGPTGAWRFEIDDSKAELNTGALKSYKKVTANETMLSGRVRLEDVFTHPELYQQYPHLKNLEVKMIIDPSLKKEYQGWHYGDPYPHGGLTFYVEARTHELAKSTLLHEIQHNIQKIEGDPRIGYVLPGTANLHPKYQEIVKDAKIALEKLYPNMDKKLREAMLPEWVRYALYQHNNLEIESRLTEERRNMNDIARKQYPPFPPYDVFDKVPIYIHNIVKKHLGTEIFDYLDYSKYLESPEFAARQAKMDADIKRRAGIIEAHRQKVAEERAQAEKAASGEQAKIDRAKAEEEALQAERAAAEAQGQLDKFIAEHQDQILAAERARQEAVQAEGELFKATERMKDAEARLRAAEKEHAKIQEEMEIARQEKEFVEAIRRIEEEARQTRIDAEKERDPGTVAIGMSDPSTRTAWISAMALEPKLVAREESGHAIRASGLFTDKEWRVLRDEAAKRDWIGDLPEDVRDKYFEAYGHRGGEGIVDAMIEEAIMHRFAKGPEAWGPPDGVVARFMHRIRQLLDRVANWMKGMGFQTAEDVFNAMESGKISSRDTMAPHAARRAGEIEARMEELKPTVLDAYQRAREAAYADLPTVAQAQRTLWQQGFAPAMTKEDLAEAIQQIYGPREPIKFSPSKVGELPVELQLDEQRLQTMLAEGYKPLDDELKELNATKEALDEALRMEQGYLQAAECLIMAGV